MFIFTEKNSIANTFIAELRDINIQKDRLRFRKNLERLGNLFAYEISKSMVYNDVSINTPLGMANTQLVDQAPVLACILRAALPLYEGMLSFFDQAESAFIGAYRGPHQKDNSFEIIQNYAAAPDLTEKVLILIDPMLATGKSIASAYEALFQHGTPKSVHFVSIIASRPGISFVQKKFPQAHLWLGAVDEELNQKSYIIPGLGDAGDLAFGPKL